MDVEAPLPSSSSSSSWEFPLPVLPWGTSPKYPNKVHKYAEACHLGIASKSPLHATWHLWDLPHRNLSFDSTHFIPINPTSPVNNIKIIFLKDKCPFGQLSCESI